MEPAYAWLGLSAMAVVWLGFFQLARELAHRGRIPADWRIAWLLASASWGTLLVFIVEISSAFTLLNAPTLLVGWMGSALALVIANQWLAQKRGVVCVDIFKVVRQRLPQHWNEPWHGRGELALADAKLMLGFATVLIAVLFFIAVATPTTNWDSLAYHLPRVMHWIQQRSVEHYPTSYTHQIEFGPWSGFVLTTLHLFSGGDRFDNLVQWFAMLSSVIVATFLARQLLDLLERFPCGQTRTVVVDEPTRRRVSALTALLVVSLPIGIVESVTTQTDYTTAFWMLGLCTLLLTLMLAGVGNVWLTVASGLTLGLGVLSKTTMYFYAAPFVAFGGGYVLLRLRENRLRLRFLAIMAVAFFALNSPHLLRNYRLFGSPMGSRQLIALHSNQEVSLGGTMSNVLRNTVLHVNSGFLPLTKALHEVIGMLHLLTGKDLNDRATTFYMVHFTFTFQEPLLIYDSMASCFYHLMLALVAGMFVIRNRRQNAPLLAYALLVAASLILLSALLPWMPWNSRLHLACFVLLAPWTAVVLITRLPRWFVALAAICTTLFGLYCLIYNETRPILDKNFLRQPREQQYLIFPAPGAYNPLAELTDQIARSTAREVGLHFPGGDLEQMLWIMLRNRGFQGRLDEVWAENPSSAIPVTHPRPDVVIANNRGKGLPLLHKDYPYQSHHAGYTAHWSEAASRWADCYHFEKQSYLLPQSLRKPVQQGGHLKLEAQQKELFLSTVRPGKLRFEGKISINASELPSRELHITVNDGPEILQPLSSGEASFSVPVLAGTNTIRLSVSGPLPLSGAQIVLENTRWSWHPAGQP